MDIEQTYKDIKSKENDVLGNVELYLMEKSNSNRIYYFVDTDTVQTEVYEMIEQSVARLKTKNIEQQPYDLISVSGVHYNLLLDENQDEYKEVTTICSMIQNYTTETTETKIMKDLHSINIKNVKAYLVKIKTENETYIFASEVSSLAKVKRTGFMANLSDNQLKKLKRDDVIGFNSEVGLLANKNELLVVKPQLFETLFNIEREIEEKAEKTFSNLKVMSERFSKENILHIRNIEKILEAASKNKRINKRLAKISKEEDLINALFENIESVWLILESKEFKDEFSSIKYDKESNTITITSDCIDKFLTLLSDAPYESIIGKRKRLDRTR
ncbi:Kiwa anti-phage protein KwaB-like domain-containing protein [Listeria monocytogenes]|uniref:Kiwa anti-phage protein KwaB-like domain-containing protein n=1 Tax=Listeria monocytogenes TaxID=1639 RepID=UPI00086A5C8D|nr:Kiwa anti-phage protein KwaB-like domain-containing protein [Listeria monocytogenes]EAD2807291.1 DUF4868 domain-containing protein [Listeria monocytogenes]EAD9074500.1 DUF4868 domain-containing protein [Listeria monocytogenes]EAD9141688.1 DUF4868 domain-containing protein [Listeria monocytogenes]EAD9920963.1 DUF4868 domain-containing protein [Listeria monocytogenes]EAD9921797.1 DUF4868 domain-containing protein [Listeria monocytogenes]